MHRLWRFFERSFLVILFVFLPGYLAVCVIPFINEKNMEFYAEMKRNFELKIKN